MVLAPSLERADQGAQGPKQSPDYVQMSLAAAMTLGMRPGAFMRGAYTRCLNLLVTYPKGCLANCSYCGLARGREGTQPDKSFIRVEWPVAPLEEVIARSKLSMDRIERMCISMITHARSGDDTLEILDRWHREAALRPVPVSILSNPTTMDRADLEALRDRGAERFTVALDAVTEPLFDATRGRGVGGPNRWDAYWRTYELAHEVFGRAAVGVHLICGMGETEREMITTMFRARALGEYGSLQLFAFNPEEGSALSDRSRVPLGQFRRVQLARYVIDKGLVRSGDITFNDRDQIVDFGLDETEIDRVIDSGLPFRTSGCPGKECDVSACNRPFGDGPPTDFSSFPFAPSVAEVDNIRVQLADYEGRITREQVAAWTLAQLDAAAASPCGSR